MRKTGLGLVAGALLLVTTAHADVIPDGLKAVRSSVKVDGKPPAGQVLLLVNRFGSVKEVKPGQVTHVVGRGDSQLLLAKRDQLDAVKKAARAAQGLESVSIDCGQKIEGIINVQKSAKHDEVRRHVKVTANADSCTSSLTRTDRLKDGKVVDPNAKSSSCALSTSPRRPAAAWLALLMAACLGLLRRHPMRVLSPDGGLRRQPHRR